MNDINNLEDLTRVAEGATQGEWKHSAEAAPPIERDTRVWIYAPAGPNNPRIAVVEAVMREGDHCAINSANALHIATFDPPCVLSLLEEIRELRGALDGLANEQGWFGEQRFAEDTDADFLLRVLSAVRKRARQALKSSSEVASSAVPAEAGLGGSHD